MSDPKYSKAIFQEFVNRAAQNGHNAVNNRILLEIEDITTGGNPDNKYTDTCPLIMTQDYCFRQVDSMQRPENSPMPPPLVLFAIQGGAAYVQLEDMCWQAKTLESATIYRLHEVEGSREVSYKKVYETMRIIETTEILIGQDWFGVVMAKAGKVTIEQTSFNILGAAGGNIAAGADFIAGEFGA